MVVGICGLVPSHAAADPACAQALEAKTERHFEALSRAVSLRASLGTKAGYEAIYLALVRWTHVRDSTAVADCLGDGANADLFRSLWHERAHRVEQQATEAMRLRCGRATRSLLRTAHRRIRRAVRKGRLKRARRHADHVEAELKQRESLVRCPATERRVQHMLNVVVPRIRGEAPRQPTPVRAAADEHPPAHSANQPIQLATQALERTLRDVVIPWRRTLDSRQRARSDLATTEARNSYLKALTSCATQGAALRQLGAGDAHELRDPDGVGVKRLVDVERLCRDIAQHVEHLFHRATTPSKTTKVAAWTRWRF